MTPYTDKDFPVHAHFNDFNYLSGDAIVHGIVPHILNNVARLSRNSLDNPHWDELTFWNDKIQQVSKKVIESWDNDYVHTTKEKIKNKKTKKVDEVEVEHPHYFRRWWLERLLETSALVLWHTVNERVIKEWKAQSIATQIEKYEKKETLCKFGKKELAKLNDEFDNLSSFQLSDRIWTVYGLTKKQCNSADGTAEMVADAVVEQFLAIYK